MIETADTDYGANYDTNYERPIMSRCLSENFLITLKNYYLTQWRFYIGARRAKPPKSRKKKNLPPQIPRVVHNFFHYYSEALLTTAIDTVLEFTHRSATGNCK